MEEEQLNLLLESINRGPNWDVIIAIVIFVSGFLINGAINYVKNTQTKKSNIANSFWMLFVVLQNAYRKISYFRLALANQNRLVDVEEILSSFQLSKLSQDLWDKFHSFDSQINKKTRKKGEFKDFNSRVIELFEVMEKINLLIVTKRSKKDILIEVVKLEDKIDTLIKDYNKKATNLKLETN